MQQKAKGIKVEEFTYGDLITVEMILVEKMKNIDLSLHSGQYMVSLLGKIEYKIGSIQDAAEQQIPLNPVALG